MAEVWTPTQCNQLIKGRLRDLTGVQIRGEVSGARGSRGHLYFDLKDSGSKIRCTVWRSTLARLPIRPRDGEEIVCEGDVDLWVPGGTYALNVRRVRRAGLGQRHEALRRLTEQLRAEGLLDSSRRRPLPVLPQVVGLVTAPGSAALRDMLRILHDRFPVRVILSPTRVQGATAAQEIAVALRRLDALRRCDVIIVGRGGGSQEDLWAFNEEPVARAIAACTVPVVSAVGHEIDTLLSDHVADARAPTPTAAAEMVVPSMVEVSARLVELRQRLGHAVASQLRLERRELRGQAARLSVLEGQLARVRLKADHLQHRLLRSAARDVQARRAQLQVLVRALSQVHPVRRLLSRRQRLSQLQGRLEAAQRSQLSAQGKRVMQAQWALVGGGRALTPPLQRHLTHLDATLQALNPSAALARGYSIIRDAETGEVMVDAAQLEVGQELSVTLARGGAVATVERTLESV